MLLEEKAIWLSLATHWVALVPSHPITVTQLHQERDCHHSNGFVILYNALKYRQRWRRPFFVLEQIWLYFWPKLYGTETFVMLNQERATYSALKALLTSCHDSTCQIHNLFCSDRHRCMYICKGWNEGQIYCPFCPWYPQRCYDKLWSIGSLLGTHPIAEPYPNKAIQSKINFKMFKQSWNVSDGRPEAKNNNKCKKR